MKNRTMRSMFVKTMGVVVMPIILHAEVSHDVRVNSIGYKPSLAKHATVMGDHADAAWTVHAASDGSVVLSGTLPEATTTFDSEEVVQLADFSALSGTGTFYLEVDGVGRSVDFRVGEEVYNDSLELQLAGLYGLRCGSAVTLHHDGETFHHAACHVNDGKMDCVGGSGIQDGSGGWHDAGDYGKYMVNTAFTMGVMLRAWEHYPEQLKQITLAIPESGGRYPDYLSEMKVELDWMMKNAAVYGDGRIPHKLTRKSFAPMIMPESDTEDRYWVPYGSAATAGFAAVMAQAARVYKPYDADYAEMMLQAANRSYAWLVEHPEDHPSDQTGFSTGGYETPDADVRLWAAAEIWESTGAENALKDFEGRAAECDDKIRRSWGWGDQGNLGMFAYLDSKRNGKNASLVTAIQRDLLMDADGMIKSADAHGFGRGLEFYFWGCNGEVALQGMILKLAHEVTGKQKYLDCAMDQISHLYGRNTYNRSYITGEGINPPMHPHHRPSEADGIVPPWPGLLVGGGWPKATDWKDEEGSYQTNEVAINWTASMVYLLSMFVDYTAQ